MLTQQTEAQAGPPGSWLCSLSVTDRPTVHPGAHGICFLETISLDRCIAEHSGNPAHDDMLLDSLESNMSTGLGRQDEAVARLP